MCVVSNIMDGFNDHWRDRDSIKPFLQPAITTTNFPIASGMTQLEKQEFEKLKNEVELLKILLKKAKIYDEETGQPDCEIEEKMVLVRKIAALVGVDLDDILKPKE